MSLIDLNQRECNLIALLASGHTDVSAAQAMSISARSVTNIMRHLMDRLGVDNRFQLGLALGALRAAEPPSFAAARSGDPSGDSALDPVERHSRV